MVVASLALGSALAACGDDGGGSDDAVVLSPAGERGKELARVQGCISCHTTDGSKSTGPSWKGLAGSEVTLDDGTTVVADDAYLHTAIIASRAQVVDGFANVMPVYDGELTEAEIADLIAYLHDLAPAEGTSTTS